MNCPVCGREVKEGQVYCECGRPVSYSSGGTTAASPVPEITPEQLKAMEKKPRKPLPIWPLFILAAAVAALAIIFVPKLLDSYRVTHSGSWETVSGIGYSMKMPKGMDKGELKTSYLENAIDYYYNNVLIIDVSKRIFSDYEREQVGEDVLAALEYYNESHTVTVNGQKVEMQRRGNMLWYDYSDYNEEAFDGTNDLRTVEAAFAGYGGIYIIKISCAEDRYSKYKDSIFEMLDTVKTDM